MKKNFYEIIEKKLNISPAQTHDYWIDFCDEVLEPLGYKNMFENCFHYRFTFYKYVKNNLEEV